MLTEAALAHRGPMLVAPAMNPRMWSHPATQANAETLRARGVELIGPEEGETAEGELGVGRMAEPEEIFARGEELLARHGPARAASACSSPPAARASRSTRCASSATARRAAWASRSPRRRARRGAHVTLLAANLAVAGAGRRRGRRDADRRRRSSARRSRAPRAPTSCSWPPPSPTTGRPRRSRRSGRRTRAAWTVELEPTTDVLATLGERRATGQVLVGFAADQGERGLERAREKLDDKNADLIVFNDVARDRHRLRRAATTRSTLVAGERRARVAKAPKDEIAAAILDEVERLLG